MITHKSGCLLLHAHLVSDAEW